MDLGYVALRGDGDYRLRLACDACSEVTCDAEDGDTLDLLRNVALDHECQMATCRHCQRAIAYTTRDGWIDPEAPRNPDEDDRIWRETCDAHDTFRAEHEPVTP